MISKSIGFSSIDDTDTSIDVSVKDSNYFIVISILSKRMVKNVLCVQTPQNSHSVTRI